MSVPDRSAAEVTFRAWRESDLESLVVNANNRSVWINLKDLFPHPFTAEHGRAWLETHATAQQVATDFAIDLGGDVVGGVGIDVCEDVYRHTGVVHYWLGERFWRRGIGTATLKFMIAHAWNALSLDRLQAAVFEWNVASARTLHKVGFVEEGRLRRAVIKDGMLGDLLLFGLLRDESPITAHAPTPGHHGSTAPSENV